jgi:hypothetical protein
MKISEIEQAITELSDEELVDFRAWFDEYCAQIWDEQIEKDVKSGRLNRLISKADEEYDAGLSKLL